MWFEFSCSIYELNFTPRFWICIFWLKLSAEKSKNIFQLVYLWIFIQYKWINISILCHLLPYMNYPSICHLSFFIPIGFSKWNKFIHRFTFKFGQWLGWLLPIYISVHWYIHTSSPICLFICLFILYHILIEVSIHKSY